MAWWEKRYNALTGNQQPSDGGTAGTPQDTSNQWWSDRYQQVQQLETQRQQQIQQKPTITPLTAEEKQDTSLFKNIVGDIGRGLAKFIPRVGVEISNLASSTVDLAGDILARTAEIDMASPDSLEEMVADPSAVERRKENSKKWREFYDDTVGRKTEDIKKLTESLRQNKVIKPTEEWSSSSLRDKFTPQHIAETILYTGPGVLASMGTFALNPGLGFTLSAGSVADDVKSSAMENGVSEDGALAMGLATGLVVGAIDKIVPDELFSPAEKSTFARGLGKRLLSYGLLASKEAGTEVVQEDIQIGVESTFRDDLGWEEVKTRNVMSALGGFLGGAGGKMSVDFVNGIARGDIAAVSEQDKAKMAEVMEETYGKDLDTRRTDTEEILEKEDRREITPEEAREILKDEQIAESEIGRVLSENLPVAERLGVNLALVRNSDTGEVSIRLTDIGSETKTPVVPEEDILRAVRNIQRRMQTPEVELTEDTINTLKKVQIGVDELDFSEDGTITLYRDYDPVPGKARGFSIERTSGQKPYVLNKEDILVNTNSQELVDYYNKAFDPEVAEGMVRSLKEFNGLESEVMAVVPEESSGEVSDSERIIRTNEQKIKDAYSENIDLVEEELGMIFMEMDVAEAGERIFVENPNSSSPDIIGIKSTFPQWIPSNLRRKNLFDKVLSGIVDIQNLKYPEGNRTAQRALYDTILEELDSRTGIDTSEFRGAILDAYDGETQEITSESLGRGRPDREAEETSRAQQEIKGREALEELAEIHETPKDFYQALRPTQRDAIRRGADSNQPIYDFYAEVNGTNVVDRAKDVAPDVRDYSMEERAKEEFLTTENPEEALFITTQGEFIDGTGKNQVGESERQYMTDRIVDHREVAQFVSEKSGSEALIDYMNKTGNVRMYLSNGDLFLDISREPTQSQWEAIEEAFAESDGTIVADISTESGGIGDSGEFNSFEDYKDFVDDYFDGVKSSEGKVIDYDRRLITQEEMLENGADGSLSQAVLVDLPVDLITGREPAPAPADGAEEYTPGREITQPVEVSYTDQGDFVLYAGNHRIQQAEVNGQETIKAYVEPEDGDFGRLFDRLNKGADIEVSSIEDIESPEVRSVIEGKRPAEGKINETKRILKRLSEQTKASSRPRADTRLIAKSPTELKNVLDSLNKFGQEYAILRKTGGVSDPKAVGQFAAQYGKMGLTIAPEGEIRFKGKYIANDKDYMSVLAHELGHAIEYNVTGALDEDTYSVFGDLTEDQRTTIENELKEITTTLEGQAAVEESAEYYNKPTELLARFFELYIINNELLQDIAPNAYEAIETQSIKRPMIRQFMETVDENLREIDTPGRMFLPDLRESYQKALGSKRVGNIAYHAEITHRALVERAKLIIPKFIDEKFENVKDNPETLFRAAESILVTRDGEPVFGTRDYIYTNDSKEIANITENGYEKVAEVVRDGETVGQYAKQRYTAEEGEAIFNSLSPEGQQLIKDFTAQRDQAKDYFNREVIKDVNNVYGDIEGWVYHYFEGEPDTAVSKKKRFRKKTAGTRKKRTGAEGFSMDFKKAMTKVLIDLETEKLYNDFIQKQFATVSKPIPKGKDADEGWVEVVGTLKRGIGTRRENKMVVVKDGKTFVPNQTRYQVPKLVYERYKMYRGLVEEAGTFAKTLQRINSYWAINVLSSAGTAGTNFIGGGLQFSTKVLTDFYTETLTGQLDYKQTRRDVTAMFKVLLPKGWQDAPDWVWGGDLSNYYGQFSPKQVGKVDKAIDKFADTNLKLFGTYERYWKKVISLSEGVQNLDSLQEMTKEGLRLPTDLERQALAQINDEVDLYAYDYDNIPMWLSNMKRNPVATGIKPFATYPYKYAKQITNMIGSVFDRSLPWQERAAKLMSLATVMGLYAMFSLDRKEKQETPEADSPEVEIRARAAGNLFTGITDEEGNELFVRVSKYPFIGLTEAAVQTMRGNSTAAANIVKEMLGSVGFVGTTALHAFGYRDEYEKYDPPEVIYGEDISSLVPYMRLLDEASRMLDPFKRKEETFGQSAIGRLVPVTSEDLQEKLHGEKRTVRIPIEGEVKREPGTPYSRTTVDRTLKNYWQDILIGSLAGIYIKRVNPEDVEAQIIRDEKNRKKREDKK